MALVDNFPAEPGRGRCGESFASRIVVTGHIPGTDGFGSDLTYEIPGYIAFSKTLDAAVDPAELGEVRQVIEAVRQRIVAQKFQNTDWFTQKELRSLTLLLQRADILSTGAQELWDKWSQREGGSWPLWIGDSFDDFPFLVCDGVEPGGRVVIDRVAYICPSQAEVDQRPRDRELLSAALQEALTSLRCADYHFNRVRLYRRAKADYEALPGQGGAFVATPKPEPEGPFLQAPTEVPDSPEGEEIPDPDELPDLEGEGVVVEPDRPGLTVPDALKKRAPQLLVAGGGVLLATGITVALLGR